MGCVVKFSEPLVQIDFPTQYNKQKMFIEILTNYGDMNIDELALVLDVSVELLKDICLEKQFLEGEPSDSLTQLFVMFFGGQFFRDFYVIRRFN